MKFQTFFKNLRRQRNVIFTFINYLIFVRDGSQIGLIIYLTSIDDWEYWLKKRKKKIYCTKILCVCEKSTSLILSSQVRFSDQSAWCRILTLSSSFEMRSSSAFYKVSFRLEILSSNFNESEFFNCMRSYFRPLVSIESISKRWLKILLVLRR
jgi:hypothetical protein